jgi:hypothetical protein
LLVFAWLFQAQLAFAQHTDPDGRTHSADFLPAWTSAPRGIPTPSFGITYVTDSPPDQSVCTNWPTAATTRCYYVDRTHGSATDTANANGYPNQPRLTIPTSITSSTDPVLVVVAGSGYTYSGSVTYTFDGSSTAPIYIIAGSGRPDFAGSGAIRTITIGGDYWTIYGLAFEEVYIRTAADTQKAAFSYNEFGPVASGNVGFGWGLRNQDVVVYRNYFHNLGTALPLATEDDFHAAKPSTTDAADSLRLWFVDNHVHDVAGDVFQCGSEGGTGPDISTWPRYIYVGRNTGHTTGENHTDIKACRDVIISENNAYDFRREYLTAGGTGAAMVIHGLYGGSSGDSALGANRTWVIFNRIHNSRIAIASTGQNGFYNLGNLIYSIAHAAAESAYSYTTGSQTGGAAMHTRSNAVSPVFQHNTVYGSDRGINCETSQACVILDNIFASNLGASTAMGWEDSNNASSTVANNLVHYGSNGMKFGGLVDTFYASLATFNAAATVDCTGCVENGVDFTDAAAQDFTLQATSDAIDAASDDRTYYDLFFTTYGISIKFDFAGNALPDTDADIGAYQFDSGTPPASQPQYRLRRRF